MSDGIRKPWLLDYLVAYAEQHGGELSSTQHKRGKVQIINFRTLPESLEEWVWADVSDKKHAVPVRFTMEAVKTFNHDLRNAGRRLTTRRWSVATIRCAHPLWCRPPTENGKRLEDKWTIALVVDQIEVAASEGEAMFGDPRCVTREQPMRRWLEGLREPHGPGGNVLKLERLQREKEEKENKTLTEKDQPAITRRSTETMFQVDSRSSRKPTGTSKKPNERQRFKQWTAQMKELGLVLTYDHHKVPEDQLRALREMIAFGMTSRMSQSPTKEQKAQEAGPSTPTPVKNHASSPALQRSYLGDPTTPSHWSASQRTNVGQDLNGDGDGDEPMLSETTSSPINPDDVIDVMEEDAVPQSFELQGQQGSDMLAESINQVDEPGFDVLRTGREDAIEVYEDVTKWNGQSTAARGPVTPKLSSPKRRTRHASDHHAASIPAPVPTRKPMVLVPDSDMSQSQSLTQPSISQQSADSQHNSQGIVPVHPTITSIPESSYAKHKPPSPKSLTSHRSDVEQEPDDDESETEENELDTDDEAAQRILTSGGANNSRTTPRLQPRGSSPQPLTTSARSDTSLVLPLHDRKNHGTVSPDRSRKKPMEPVSTVTGGSHHNQASEAAGIRGRKRTLAEMTTPGKQTDEFEPPPKRHKGADDVVIEKVQHDAAAWKEPSFVRSRTKSLQKSKETRQLGHQESGRPLTDLVDRTREPEASSVPGGSYTKHSQRVPSTVSQSKGNASTANILPESRSERDSQPAVAVLSEIPDSQHNKIARHQSSNPSTNIETHRPGASSHPDTSEAQRLPKDHAPSHTLQPSVTTLRNENIESESHGEKPLKLGGWRPRKDVPNGPGVMTWERFNQMLLKVGRVRTQANRSQTKAE